MDKRIVDFQRILNVNLIGTYWWTAFIFILIAIIGIFGIKFYNKYVAK
jgi:hypothetical protein